MGGGASKSTEPVAPPAATSVAMVLEARTDSLVESEAPSVGRSETSTTSRLEEEFVLEKQHSLPTATPEDQERNANSELTKLKAESEALRAELAKVKSAAQKTQIALQLNAHRQQKDMVERRCRRDALSNLRRNPSGHNGAQEDFSRTLETELVAHEVTKAMLLEAETNLVEVQESARVAQEALEQQRNENPLIKLLTAHQQAHQVDSEGGPATKDTAIPSLSALMESLNETDEPAEIEVVSTGSTGVMKAGAKPVGGDLSLPQQLVVMLGDVQSQLKAKTKELLEKTSACSILEVEATLASKELEDFKASVTGQLGELEAIKKEHVKVIEELQDANKELVLKTSELQETAQRARELSDANISAKKQIQALKEELILKEEAMDRLAGFESWAIKLEESLHTTQQELKAKTLELDDLQHADDIMQRAKEQQSEIQAFGTAHVNTGADNPAQDQRESHRQTQRGTSGFSQKEGHLVLESLDATSTDLQVLTEVLAVSREEETNVLEELAEAKAKVEDMELTTGKESAEKNLEERKQQMEQIESLKESLAKESAKREAALSELDTARKETSWLRQEVEILKQQHEAKMLDLKVEMQKAIDEERASKSGLSMPPVEPLEIWWDADPEQQAVYNKLSEVAMQALSANLKSPCESCGSTHAKTPDNGITFECAVCSAPIMNQARVDAELAALELTMEADALDASTPQQRKTTMQASGVSVSWLKSFLAEHGLAKTTAQVAEVVRSHTQAHRIRYVQLNRMRQHVGCPQVYVSHTWGALFSDTVGAIAYVLPDGAFVWMDIFAMRQWPGNAAVAGQLKSVPALLQITGSLLLCATHVPAVARIGRDDHTADKVALDTRITCSLFHAENLGHLQTAHKLGKPAVVVIGTADARGQVFTVNAGMCAKLCGVLDWCRAAAQLQDWREDGGILEAVLKAGGEAVQEYNDVCRAAVASAEGSMHHPTVLAAICGFTGALDSVVADEPDPSLRHIRAGLLSEALLAAAAAGSNDLVSFLLQKGADAFSVDSKGQSSLHLAAKCGNPEIIQQILQANVPVDIMDSHGTTALMLAAGGGQEQVLSTLLSAGAKIQGTTKDGQDALKLACHGGHVGIVKALVKAGAVLQDEGETGNSAVQIAMANQHPEIVRTLVEEGVNLQTVDKWTGKTTALHTAAEGHGPEIVRALIEGGAPIDSVDGHKNTALHLACENGRLDVVQVLLDLGANLHAKTRMGSTAVEVASLNGHKEIVQLIKETLVSRGEQLPEQGNRSRRTSMLSRSRRISRQEPAENIEQQLAYPTPASLLFPAAGSPYTNAQQHRT